MGALGGSLTMTCYYVDGDVPKDFREAYLASLMKHRFTDVNVDLDREESVGWVNIADPFDTEFDLNKVLWGSYFMAALRHDTIRLPATAFKLHLRKACAEVMKKTGKEKLSKAETDDVRERLEKQLKKKMLPNIKTFDMVWNMERQVVWLFATNKKVNEQFVDFFQESFGLVPHEKNPYAQMERGGFEEKQLVQMLELEPAAMSAPPGEGKRKRKSAA